MAYQIDFTASEYVVRSRMKIVLRLLLAAAICSFAWGVRYVYVTYNQPTLNMKLADYESAARPIEEMNRAWDQVAEEYGSMLKYYRLVWAESPTNFLTAAAATDAPRLGQEFRIKSWRLATGGECRLEYTYVFDRSDSIDKAEMAKKIEPALKHMVTSVVHVADGKITVSGVRYEKLRDVWELPISVRFSLPDAMKFPVKNKELSSYVEDIVAMRRKVQDAAFADPAKAKGAPVTAQGVMMAYLSMGRDKPDFPGCTPVIDVSGWMGRADQFIVRNRIPGDERDRSNLKESWNRIGDARFPWDRFRQLDNDEIVAGTRSLTVAADGVRRFKSFLEQRHVDCERKLTPLVEAYRYQEIGNKPVIEEDLRGRVAGAVGISSAAVSFSDEPEKHPPVLMQNDEKFTFVWIRWRLSLGGKGKDGEFLDRGLTLETLAKTASRIVNLGPGYMIDSVSVVFEESGRISSAVIEGLLPTKRIESNRKDEVKK